MRTSTPRTVASAVAGFAAIVLGNSAEAKDFAPADAFSGSDVRRLGTDVASGLASQRKGALLRW